MTRKIIDLFAGAGGLTTGFHMAGFESLCAIDIDAKALATYKHNYPNTKIIHQDIRQVNPSDLRLALGLQPEELTALIGGPPCQGFSRNIPAGDRYLNDSRNQMYQTFLDFVQEFRPLYVVMENVPEILKAYNGVISEEITKNLKSLGYKVVSSALNAAYYGVPQTRSRAFFLASLDHSLNFPEPTHFGDIKSDYRSRKSSRQLNFLQANISEIVTVRDAIGDLPPINAGQVYDAEIYPSEPKTTYQAMMRSQSMKIVNHIARALSPIQMSRARVLCEGQDARDLPPELAPKKHYSGAYGRLYWDKPARTITRWVFHPGSGRFFHPTQDRTITIREAARLHSYPDSFHFLGTYTDMASQIGESVPPLLGKAIASSILQANLQSCC
ncbi:MULTISPECIES: DNA cytosine methyltransferase [unclassified Tolypothrix]|uniref:DNA cytosine methyltransferase n=1 Tax=unclassified Tolypothrix TaxID=2649714 RepID=UPI0005EAB272|nr:MULTISPECIES: DNA cytosine methyltransferase [unclassified Tolypothrix]BAY93469.1 cytosine specific DNA methyltransferase [Microchaete diplosiphon NIES-3275]EKE99472.1 DNA (cytosine-5-)-methyltransferase [Tolypothrix sp. PCC 7601]MBE9080826.1 DNA cytosine methyltransferase [Tolypothrix sp. LEGE 11397]UYD27311.1 DNA cytosine methyltransferase [Tolypothrix sp. PCC 7712]UYD36829.1 DNA cytosine methyltransferase [Tolypothrix sp. PCC 7601]